MKGEGIVTSQMCSSRCQDLTWTQCQDLDTMSRLYLDTMSRRGKNLGRPDEWTSKSSGRGDEQVVRTRKTSGRVCRLDGYAKDCRPGEWTAMSSGRPCMAERGDTWRCLACMSAKCRSRCLHACQVLALPSCMLAKCRSTFPLFKPLSCAPFPPLEP